MNESEVPVDDDFDDDFDDEEFEPYRLFDSDIFQSLFELEEAEISKLDEDDGKLPELIKLLLEEEFEHELTISIRMRAGYTKELDRRIGNQILVDIDVQFFQLETIHRIGSFTAWKTHKYLFYDDIDIMDWANMTSGSACQAFRWLDQSEEVDIATALMHGILYVDRAYIKPKWRSHDLSLKALTTLIETIGSSFVFLKPSTFHPKNPTEHKKSIRKLKKHWKRAGLTQYDKDFNYLWQQDWICPHEFYPTDSSYASLVDD